MYEAIQILWLSLLQTYLLLRRNDCLIVKRVRDNVDTHRLACLVVEVLEEWSKVLELEQRQNVVVVVYRDLHQASQLLRDGA